MNTKDTVKSMLNLESNMIDTCIGFFVSEGKPFTSIDLSNMLKKNGYWVSNSVITTYLAKLRDEGVFEPNGNAVHYICTPIDGIHIYHSVNDNPLNANIHQDAIKPGDFNMTMNPVGNIGCEIIANKNIEPEETFNVAFQVSQDNRDILFYTKTLTRKELEKMIRTFKVI